MTYDIPLAAVPSQTLSIQLGGKACRLSIYQKRTGLYADMTVNDRLVLTWLVRGAHFGFPGDLTFIDGQGSSDPHYTGLGTRYRLVWRA